jgi:hypothetical protein
MYAGIKANSVVSKTVHLLIRIRLIEILYILVAIIVPAQRYFLGHYNNFKIFRSSTIHFFEGVNLYAPDPARYYDVFLYNPSFALLFAPFSYLPVAAGIWLWIVFVLAVYYFSIRLLPFDSKTILFVYLFTFQELITALENLQTNPLIAAFFLFTFIYLERDKLFRSTLFPNLGFFIKGYGAVSGLLLLLKRPRARTFGYLALWFILLFSLPLVWYSPSGLITLYQQWKTSLLTEHNMNTGISLITMVEKITGLEISTLYFQLPAILLLILTAILIAVRKNYEAVKVSLLAYLMIWVIIFNHDAESATYIIAVTGIAIWYFRSEKRPLDTVLIVITFILTVLSPTDIFPSVLYKKFIVPYSLKALGPSLIWFRIQLSLMLPEKINDVCLLMT